jgi:hypothetical protein
VVAVDWKKSGSSELQKIGSEIKTRRRGKSKEGEKKLKTERNQYVVMFFCVRSSRQ